MTAAITRARPALVGSKEHTGTALLHFRKEKERMNNCLIPLLWNKFWVGHISNEDTMSLCPGSRTRSAAGCVPGRAAPDLLPAGQGQAGWKESLQGCFGSRVCQVDALVLLRNASQVFFKDAFVPILCIFFSSYVFPY